MTPSPLRRRFALASLVVAALAAASCMAMSNVSPPPPGPDYATTRASDAGRFHVSFRADADPVPVGRLHTWTLHVTRADGAPVTNATIKVDGDMPQHGHGLPTRPRVTRHLGNGDYLIEGIKFQMGGWWVMEFTITAQARKDVAKFNLLLKR